MKGTTEKNNAMEKTIVEYQITSRFLVTWYPVAGLKTEYRVNVVERGGGAKQFKAYTTPTRERSRLMVTNYIQSKG